MNVHLPATDDDITFTHLCKYVYLEYIELSCENQLSGYTYIVRKYHFFFFFFFFFILVCFDVDSYYGGTTLYTTSLKYFLFDDTF